MSEDPKQAAERVTLRTFAHRLGWLTQTQNEDQDVLLQHDITGDKLVLTYHQKPPFQLVSASLLENDGEPGVSKRSVGDIAKPYAFEVLQRPYIERMFGPSSDENWPIDWEAQRLEIALAAAAALQLAVLRDRSAIEFSDHATTLEEDKAALQEQVRALTEQRDEFAGALSATQAALRDVRAQHQRREEELAAVLSMASRLAVEKVERNVVMQSRPVLGGSNDPTD